MRVQPDHRSPSNFARVAAWFISLLIPTLAIKYEYVKILAGGDPSGMATFVSHGKSTSLWWLFSTLLAPADVIDVALIVGALLLLGHLILRASIPLIACISVFVALVVYGASALSLHETGSLITVETLRVSFFMSTNEPNLAWALVTWRGIVLAGLCAAWTLSPLVLARAIAYFEWTRLRFFRYVVLAVLVPSAAVAVQQPAAFLSGSDVPALSRGFWQSAASALLGGEVVAARVVTERSSEEMKAAYARLVYPHGRVEHPMPILDVPLARRRPRHIFILLLETAPQKFYPLVDNEELPTFHSMSQRALVSTRHYTVAPISDQSVYSVITGTYPRPGTSISRSGHFTADSLPITLRARGYDSTFIDSAPPSWNDWFDTQARDFGFNTVVDEKNAPPLGRDPVTRETKSITLALDAILDAERRGRKAFVVVPTHIGHWPWLFPDEGQHLSPPAKLMATAKLFDKLMARFLDSLAAHGLSDEVIIVVIGDHGLRFNMEFTSLAEPPRYGDTMFNVPFLMYAPALFPKQVRLPYVTSHVDIAPTLLDLTGTPCDECIHHGDNMLDRRLADRITFMSSAAFPGLYPVDGFHFKDQFYAFSRLFNRVTVRRDGESAETTIGDERVDALTASQTREIVAESQRMFNETAEVFLGRQPPVGSQPGGAPVTQGTR